MSADNTNLVLAVRGRVADIFLVTLQLLPDKPWHHR
ncbi:hypothetical protein BMETH_29651107212, partial [methanotrophic bacterial endosymbiont of Bathymodiolus sp.]